MTQHRRSHVTEAIAQIQNEQSFLANGAAATNVISVPGIKVGDNLVSVNRVNIAPPIAFADYTIYEPQAFAKFVLGGSAFAVDSYVNINGLLFIFSDRTGNLVEDNFPAGSNSSNRYYVPFAGVAATDLAALVAAINAAYQTEEGGVLPTVTAAVNVNDLDLTAGAYGAAGESVLVGFSADLTLAEWQDGAAAPATNLTLTAGDVEGILSATDDSSLAGVGGLDVIWQPFQNNDTLDNAELAASTHVGTYGPGDPVYDSAAGDPGNVGYGPGRMPPGWQP